jgi:hypothetical protein
MASVIFNGGHVDYKMSGAIESVMIENRVIYSPEECVVEKNWMIDLYNLMCSLGIERDYDGRGLHAFVGPFLVSFVEHLEQRLATSQQEDSPNAKI